MKQKVFTAQNMVEETFLEQVEKLIEDYRNGLVDLNDLLPDDARI